MCPSSFLNDDEIYLSPDEQTEASDTQELELEQIA